MTNSNRFTNARIERAGSTRGDDLGSHELFKIVGTDGAALYGEYILSFPENGNDFNIEIDQFGFSEAQYLSSVDPERRQRFSAEEARTAEDLIRSFCLSKPEINLLRLPPDLAPRVRFMGSVTFRATWIVVFGSLTAPKAGEV
jgi:hypothetical protein